jgi:RNase H-like domain found in reverse transcriptase/Integrase zinc binding domain/Reverse transcriptase (RNA-dependent DNA polymerase)
MQERRAPNEVDEVAELVQKRTSVSRGNRNPGLRLQPANQRSANRWSGTTAQHWRFRPVVAGKAPVVRLSRRFDSWSIQQSKGTGVPTKGTAVGVFAAYKRKAQKVRPVDSGETDGQAPGGKTEWKQLAKEREREQPRAPPGKYDQWITPKFSAIARGARLTPERADRMIVGEDLTDKERDVMLEMLYNREAALAWDFSEIGKVKEDVAPPQVIRTVPHKAWQARGFAVPRALDGIVIEMLKERMAQGLLEHCQGPYRNPWFLVKKKSGKYRMVNAAMEINRVTIRDANLPPVADEFAEEFAGMHMTSLIDFFSGYDQVELAKESRDLTAFMAPGLGLLRQTTLPQGATNSVAQFVRITSKILEEHIPVRCRPFIDDIGVKGPKTKYDGEEVVPGIRRYALEHIQNLDIVLSDLERAGCTISGEKSQFCMSGIKIVGFICDCEGRHPESAKIEKVVDWPRCRTPKDIKAFLGLCVYYRIWVYHFSIIAGPLYRLLRKDAAFDWGLEHDEAMDALKEALVSAPALVTLDYSEGAGLIILMVDASLRGWGAVLMQLERGTNKRHPVRYESGVWTAAESAYDAGKRECRGLLKALKKFRFWLYGIHFRVETDAATLVAQLNRSASDLPGALTVRWFAWIRLFRFEVKHVPGIRNAAADSLSRRPATAQDLDDANNEQDIDDFIDADLDSVRVRVMPIADAQEDEAVEKAPVLEEGYSNESIAIATYLLLGGARPTGISSKEFKKFRGKALRFLVRDQHLFRRASKNIPIRRVVDDNEQRIEILRSLHDDGGHRGNEGTYRRVADRYWWATLWDDTKVYVRTCEEC